MNRHEVVVNDEMDLCIQISLNLNELNGGMSEKHACLGYLSLCT